MSRTTGSRHNCEQGQGYSPPQQRNHRGGGERHHRPHPTEGGGGDTMGWGGEGGCGSPAAYMPGGLAGCRGGCKRAPISFSPHC